MQVLQINREMSRINAGSVMLQDLAYLLPFERLRMRSFLDFFGDLPFFLRTETFSSGSAGATSN